MSARRMSVFCEGSCVKKSMISELVSCVKVWLPFGGK